MARTQIRGNTQIMAGSIGNAEIAIDAAIAYSKLDLEGNIDNADIATDAAIAYSKLDLALSVDNSDIATDAAIAQSKLDLAISDSEVATDAAIAESKIAFDATDGHDHDGTNSKIVSAVSVGKFDVSRETPTGDVDGTNTDFTLATSPISGSEHIWLNGALQQLGTDADYAIDGAVITFNDAPETDDRIVVSYGTA
jgi:hypothetical protein